MLSHDLSSPTGLSSSCRLLSSFCFSSSVFCPYCTSTSNLVSSLFSHRFCPACSFYLPLIRFVHVCTDRGNWNAVTVVKVINTEYQQLDKTQHHSEENTHSTVDLLSSSNDTNSTVWKLWSFWFLSTNIDKFKPPVQFLNMWIKHSHRAAFAEQLLCVWKASLADLLWCLAGDQPLWHKLIWEFTFHASSPVPVAAKQPQSFYCASVSWMIFSSWYAGPAFNSTHYSKVIKL